MLPRTTWIKDGDFNIKHPDERFNQYVDYYGYDGINKYKLALGRDILGIITIQYHSHLSLKNIVNELKNKKIEFIYDVNELDQNISVASDNLELIESVLIFIDKHSTLREIKFELFNSLEIRLTGAQKNIIEGTFNFIFDSIRELKESDALISLKAIKAKIITPEEIEYFQTLDIWECIQQARRILLHPNPENRSESYPYVGQEDGFSMARIERSRIRYTTSAGDLEMLNGRKILSLNVIRNRSSDNYVIIKEKTGLLGITAQDSDDIPAATKVDVVRYAYTLIDKVILEQQQKIYEKVKNILKSLNTSNSVENKNSQIPEQISNNTNSLFYNRILALTFAVVLRQAFENWRPPLTNDLGGWQREHLQTLKYLLEQNLSVEAAIQELNELNWLQADTLKRLYNHGLRGEHLREIKNYLETKFPEPKCYFEEPYLALENNVLKKNMKIDDAIKAVKEMNLSQFKAACITVD